jgi:hypothetical protein
MQPSRFKFINIKPLVSEAPKLSSHFTQFNTNTKNQNPRPLSQATASNHPNVLTFTLPSSEGQAGEAWEPSDVMMPFLLPAGVSYFYHDFPFHLLFHYSFLSVSFRTLFSRVFKESH